MQIVGNSVLESFFFSLFGKRTYMNLKFRLGMDLLYGGVKFNINYPILCTGDSGWPLVGAAKLMRRHVLEILGKKSFLQEIHRKYGVIAKLRAPGMVKKSLESSQLTV